MPLAIPNNYLAFLCNTLSYTTQEGHFRDALKIFKDLELSEQKIIISNLAPPYFPFPDEIIQPFVGKDANLLAGVSVAVGSLELQKQLLKNRKNAAVQALAKNRHLHPEIIELILQRSQAPRRQEYQTYDEPTLEPGLISPSTSPKVSYLAQPLMSSLPMDYFIRRPDLLVFPGGGYYLKKIGVPAPLLEIRKTLDNLTIGVITEYVLTQPGNIHFVPLLYRAVLESQSPYSIAEKKEFFFSTLASPQGSTIAANLVSTPIDPFAELNPEFFLDLLEEAKDAPMVNFLATRNFFAAWNWSLATLEVLERATNHLPMSAISKVPLPSNLIPLLDPSLTLLLGTNSQHISASSAMLRSILDDFLEQPVSQLGTLITLATHDTTMPNYVSAQNSLEPTRM